MDAPPSSDVEHTLRVRLATIAADESLARTIERSPRATISPDRPVSAGSVTALAALRAITEGQGEKLAIERTLGEGGMGVVHLATQTTLGRHVAVKTLRAGAGDLTATMRILREAWITGALEHPNVVPVYDVGVDPNGAPIIVMKRIEGRHWGELMHDKATIAERFSADDALEWNVRILSAVCNATSFAHSRGILHRDLKPENVMIGAFGEVYVLDWGIAVSMRDDPSGRLPLAKHATEVAGTPSYMAPEMLTGDPSLLSERSDVYLLGAIFYEIFAGEPPHLGGNLQAMVASVLLSNPRFPPGFPSEAARICKKAMAREPSDRFASVAELREAIEDYLRHRGSRKLAWEAKQSLAQLLHTLQDEPPSEERTLAVFNLLGECRFGYKAALSAWPENAAARQGLDRALLAVVDHELAEGDPNAAATLLREVSAAPPDVAQRVETAIKARAVEDERLRQLGDDLDPTVGSRTRTSIMAIFGVLWTALPLVGSIYESRGGQPTHAVTIGSSAVFLLLGVGLHRWARESLTKTLLNRRLSGTLGIHLVAQMVMATGMWMAGMAAAESRLMLIFTWGLTLSLLAIYVERCFAFVAVFDALLFLVGARYPTVLYPLMSLANLVFTVVVVWVWLPRQDIARVNEKRLELRRQARRLFLEGRVRTQPPEEEL